MSPTSSARPDTDHPSEPPLTAQQALCAVLATAWDGDGPRLPAPQAVPWHDLLRLAGPTNVAGLVYVLTAPMRASIPADVHEALEQAFYQAAAANTRSLHQLAQVGARLSQAGIPYVLLKGAALAEALYSDVALRLIGDLDLLVRRDRVPACRQVLLDLGYLAGQVEERPGSLLAHSNQELFEPPSPYRSPVELHWHILDVPYYMEHVPIDWFWENSVTRTVGGQPLRVLTPEANLVYLPAHLALHHRSARLHSLVDLALLVVANGGRTDWEKVVTTARSFELLSALGDTLDRLADCWPSLPLDEPRRLLGTLTPTSADARLFRLLTAEGRSNTLDWYTTMVSLPNWAARARYAWAVVFPQASYMARRYPIRARWHLPYWYLYRMAGALARLARVLPRARQIDRGAS